MSAGFQRKLSQILKRYAEVADLLSQEDRPTVDVFAKLSKEYADLTPTAEAVRELRSAQKELNDLKMLQKETHLDDDFLALTAEEQCQLEKKIPDLETRLKISLLPRDEADAKNAILEIRAGTGGEEAALFGASLLRMYQRYAETQGWHFEMIQLNNTDLGGVKEASASISGKGVFARLKFESGVHRVQRVPETEAGGRIHTSAATVAVLPEAEEVDIVIDEKELRIDVFRSSGPGGQSVNTTDSAVRVTHIPTGLVVQQQDEKSQHKNKAKALKVLRSRLYERERAQKDLVRAASRKSQVGSGDRSERIRTYNFPQGRVTDHRIHLTLYQIDEVMEGALDPFINALTTEDQAARLADMGDDS